MVNYIAFHYDGVDYVAMGNNPMRMPVLTSDGEGEYVVLLDCTGLP